MNFKYLMTNNIRERVVNAYYHVDDFALVYNFPSHPNHISHKRYSRYFTFQNSNIDQFFDGISFESPVSYLQVMNDLTLAFGLIQENHGPLSLLKLVGDLVDDLGKLEYSSL